VMAARGREGGRSLGRLVPARFRLTRGGLSCSQQPASYKFFNFFLYLIYFEIRYLTAITFDVTRITIQANNTNTY
jgi:hypothetical protein